MDELSKIRKGTKFRVTFARTGCGLKAGQVVTVDAYFKARNFRRPRINRSYILTHSFGYDTFVVRASDGIILELKRISDHRGCHIKKMIHVLQRGKSDARRMRRLARNALKFTNVSQDFRNHFKWISRNDGK